MYTLSAYFIYPYLLYYNDNEDTLNNIARENSIEL